MQFYRRVFLFYLAERIGIKVQSQFRMMSSLEQELITTIPDCLFYFFPVYTHTGNIGFGVTRDAVKITKLAIGDTYIGSVHITINLPGNFSVRYLLFAHFIRDKH